VYITHMKSVRLTDLPCRLEVSELDTQVQCAVCRIDCTLHVLIINETGGEWARKSDCLNGVCPQFVVWGFRQWVSIHICCEKHTNFELSTTFESKVTNKNEMGKRAALCPIQTKFGKNIKQSPTVQICY